MSKAKPYDEFDAHEAADRAALMQSIFEDSMCSLSFIKKNKELRKEAERLAGLLADFYQKVGVERFTQFLKDPDECDGIRKTKRKK